jgi:hypothetical protein
MANIRAKVPTGPPTIVKRRLVAPPRRRQASKTRLSIRAGRNPTAKSSSCAYDKIQAEQLTDEEWEEAGPSRQPHKPASAMATAPSQ